MKSLYVQVLVNGLLTDLVKQLAEEYSLPLKTSYNTTRGFYIQLYSKDKDDNLPGIFMKVTKQRTTLSFTCADLVGATCFSNQRKTHNIYKQFNLYK